MNDLEELWEEYRIAFPAEANPSMVAALRACFFGGMITAFGLAKVMLSTNVGRDCEHFTIDELTRQARDNLRGKGDEHHP